MTTVVPTDSVGVEIEFNTSASRRAVVRALLDAGLSAVEGRGNPQAGQWSVVSDGSIGTGWEIVSPILAADDIAANLRAAYAAANSFSDARVTDACGLHVHIGASDFHTARNLSRRIVNFEPVLDLLQSPDRRGDNNRYCKSNALRFGRDPIEQSNAAWHACERATTIRDLQRIFNGGVGENGDRYRKLNTCSLSRHGTLEWRHGTATLNYQEALYWVRFCQCFTQVAREQIRLWKKPTNIVEPMSVRFDKAMRRLPADVVRAMRARVNRFGGAI